MTYLYSDHRRILLVDQNPTTQNRRATILRTYEIEVHTASSVEEAASLSKRHTYDLVLVAAQEDSEQAGALRTQIRAIRPRQRIGLLVGPPAFIRELGSVRRAATRKKAGSLAEISPSLSPESRRELVPSPLASSPQWQEMIRRLVSNWYVEPGALSA
jgi:DNA-binding NtrC family response regulator